MAPAKRKTFYVNCFGQDTDNSTLGGEDTSKIQSLIDKYIQLKKAIVFGRNLESQLFLSQFLLDILTCEIEELLRPENSQRFANQKFFIYQVLRKKIKIEGLKDEQKDTFFGSDRKSLYEK